MDAIVQQHSGWIEVVCGSMFSGKTEELIRRVRRAQIARQKVALFILAIQNLRLYPTIHRNCLPVL